MIYFITDTKNIKIGYTKNSIQKRLKQLQTSCADKLYELGWMDGEIEEEKFLHKKFSNSRIRYNGEWFKPTDDLIDYINENNCKKNVCVYYDIENDIVMSYLNISTKI